MIVQNGLTDAAVMESQLTAADEITFDGRFGVGLLRCIHLSKYRRGSLDRHFRIRYQVLRNSRLHNI